MQKFVYKVKQIGIYANDLLYYVEFGKEDFMKSTLQGLVKQSDIMLRICPHCHKMLPKTEVLKRKTKKMCICEACGKVIDERYIVY